MIALLPILLCAAPVPGLAAGNRVTIRYQADEDGILASGAIEDLTDWPARGARA